MAARSGPPAGQPRPMRVTTNSFEISRLPVKPFYQYHEVDPEVKQPRRRTEIFDKVQIAYAQEFTPRALFDGRNIMYSSKELPRLTFEIDLVQRRTALPPGQKPRGIFNIKLTPAAIVKPTDINRLINNGEDSADTKTATNVLQMIIRQAPSMKYSRKGRSYFTEAERLEVGGGVEIWRGFFQSVRPSLGRMLINIDISMAAMHGRGRLIDYCLQILNVRDVSRLRLRSKDAGFLSLNKALKNVMVTLETDNRPQEQKRRRKIRELVEKAGHYPFDKTDSMGQVTQTTVAEHYEMSYRRRLQFPDIIGVQFGTEQDPCVVPAEMCYIPPGQLFRQKLPEQMMERARTFATKKPGERMDIIMNGVARPGQPQRLITPPALEYQNSDFVRDAGMVISTSPVMVDGRVLAPPPIRFARDSLVNPRAGAWQTLSNQLQLPIQVDPWFVINLAMSIRDEDAQRITTILIRSCQRLGIKIQMPLYRRGENASILESLKSLSQAKPVLVLVLLPERAKELRAAVKQWGDVENGIMTQCLKESKIRKAISDFERNESDQYTNNVALKCVISFFLTTCCLAATPRINAKLGGINSDAYSDLMRQLARVPYMVCGADVSHPASNIKNRPSVTSLVWSYDQYATQYASFTRIQNPHEEIIDDLGDMMTEALHQFGIRNNKVYPRRIFFFRDGVSEGEYTKVAELEIRKIEESIAHTWNALQLNVPKPTITFVVVGKRHHIRFFPSKQDEDRSGNCPAGFVADKGITSPIARDFYLLSHAGILGTSRPSHYIILKDDNFNFVPETIQELAWNLCHVYAKANRSVSIPAPVYYADIVCSRAEFYFHPNLRFADDATTTSSGSEFNLNRWKEGYGRDGKGPTVWRRMYFV